MAEIGKRTTFAEAQRADVSRKRYEHCLYNLMLYDGGGFALCEYYGVSRPPPARPRPKDKASSDGRY
jgi:hypothetical protein